MSADARRPWVAAPIAREEGGRSDETLAASGVLFRLLIMLDMLSILVVEPSQTVVARWEAVYK